MCLAAFVAKRLDFDGGSKEETPSLALPNAPSYQLWTAPAGPGWPLPNSDECEASGFEALCSSAEDAG
jgi:hypothetical protein